MESVVDGIAEDVARRIRKPLLSWIKSLSNDHYEFDGRKLFTRSHFEFEMNLNLTDEQIDLLDEYAERNGYALIEFLLIEKAMEKLGFKRDKEYDSLCKMETSVHFRLPGFPFHFHISMERKDRPLIFAELILLNYMANQYFFEKRMRQ